MANDNETLTFRIRAIAENLGAFRQTARASEDVNKETAKAAKLAEALTGANRKLTAARDREQDAIGRVRVAEARLGEIRGKANAKTSQIAAAEERLATARRNAARAGVESQRIENEFKKLAERALENNSQSSGTTAGKRWGLGFLRFFKGNEAADNFQKSGTLVGRTFGSGIGSGLESALRTEAGPAILAGLLAVVAITAPAIGAVLASSLVAAFGGGLVALGLVFAAKSDAVSTKWHDTMAQLGADMQLLSKPFEGTLIHIADVFRKTVDNFNPELRKTFQDLAGPLSRFADDVGHALDELIPAIHPIEVAFQGVLQALGPGLDRALASISRGLISLSNSVSRNPTGLADLVEGFGHLLEELLEIIGILNDANGSFERLTGGTSLVTVVVQGLVAALDLLATPLVIIAKYISAVSETINALSHNTSASGKSMSDAAAKVGGLAEALQQAGGAAHGTVPPLKDTHDIAVDNAKAAAAAKQAFEDWVTQLFALRDTAISLARSQIGLKDAIAAVQKGLKDNGKTLNQNTEAGRANYTNLLNMADASKTQTEQIIRNAKAHGDLAHGLINANITSTATKKKFIELATQMTGNSKTAKKMADQMFAIPNVSRRAILTANKEDLDRKLRNARAQLNDKNLTKERRAQINANIASLTKQLKKAQAQIDALHGKTVPITYTLNGVNFTLNTKNPSSVGRSAAGGKITGPGTGTSDTAGLYALSNQEYVVKASSAQGYGDQAMDSVNKGTAVIIPGLARGGRPKSPTVNIHGTAVFKNVAQLRKVLGSEFGLDTPGGGAGVQRWRGVALAALAAAHEPASWIGSLLSRMQRESGGNPRAINLTDINARRGDPSRGLMQTIGSTFNAFAGPYRGRGIYDPFANIYAAIRYTVSRYGSGPAGWNRPGGYKDGGWLMPGQLAYNETRRPEAVFNTQQLSAMNRPIQINLMLDGRVIQQSLLKLNRDRSYRGLGFGPGERG